MIAELVSEMTGLPRATIVYRPPILDDPTVRRPRIELAKRILHWEPTVELRDGLRKTIEWHIRQERSNN